MRATRLHRAQLARLLLGVSIVYVVGFYCIGAALKPGYSQLSNFVSEYNATGTAWAGTLTYLGFLASTALLAAFLIAAAPITRVSGTSRLGFWLLWALPLSYLLGAIAPCDAGCPLDGSPSQRWHNLLAVLAYFGMGTGIALVSVAPGFRPFRMRRGFLLLTSAAFPVVFLAMVQPEVAPWRGLLQRSLDMAMAVSLMLMMRTLTSPHRESQPAEESFRADSPG